MIGPRPSPARVLLAFVLVLPVAMLIAAVLAPWVQAALAPLAVFPLHRVFSRLVMLGVLVITVLLLWRLRLWRRDVLGFVGPWPRFLRRTATGLAAGVTLMIIALVPLFLLGLREWNARAPDAIDGWLQLAVRGLGSGIVVALIEETYFRGAMQGALQRLGALRLALSAVPVLYSAVHFLGRATSVPPDQIDGLSGFTALAGFFATYAAPLRIADAFITLVLVGLLLALVRLRWGDIAGCIGLHAGFVTVIAMFRRVSSPVAGSEFGFLVGSFDGLLGMWIALVTASACVVVWSGRARSTAAVPR